MKYSIESSETESNRQALGLASSSASRANMKDSSTQSDCQSTRNHSMKRSRPLSKFALATIALMTANNVTPAQCFGSLSSTASPSRTTAMRSQHYFTSDEYYAAASSTRFYNPLLTSNSSPKSTKSQSEAQMPTWLRIEQAHLVHDHMERLRDAMLQSFFTENEILKLSCAIQEASNFDQNKMAGAAEFCTIMVETMEMGLNALVAAAFHYCSCVSAREKQVFYGTPSKEDLSPWDFRQHGSIDSFGEHVVQIEKDASRLKRLEMVASMVMNNSPTNSHKVTPDSEKADNLRNLFLTESKDWRALAIRGAACLYRLRGILRSTESLAHPLSKEDNRVCREALHIYAPLASRLGMHRLKNELENTAFQMLYPRQYATVLSLLQQTRGSPARRVTWNSRTSWKPDIGESMEKILEQVQAEMTEILSNDVEFTEAVQDYTVTARVKEAYSTWKKMLRNKADHILQVPDAIAFRIVLNAKKHYEDEPDEMIRARERALCYYAQELCLQRWAPSPEDARFKDYIASPKANGYQSLHYTATTNWQGQVWSMEIQVRSGEMHNVAEFGLASHWDYKVRGKEAAANKNNMSRSAEGHSSVTYDEHLGRVVIQQTSDAYLRSLQEYHWQTHGSSYQQGPEPASSIDEEHTEEAELLYSNEESHIRAERIRARTQRLAPYIEALTTAQSDLARENVYVFLSQDGDEQEGGVLALPAGAVILDVLRQVDLPFLPEDCVFHNGSPAALTTRLNNGDVLSIPSMMTTSMM
jgi:ppGpp synthetase/RelA/SpoT-type nucleotidyltranferase